jgi:hypothetical protein
MRVPDATGAEGAEGARRRASLEPSDVAAAMFEAVAAMAAFFGCLCAVIRTSFGGMSGCSDAAAAAGLLRPV